MSVYRMSVAALMSLLFTGGAVLADPPAASAPVDTTAYAIKFDRAEKVGQIFSVVESVDLSQDVIRKMGGKSEEGKKDARASLEGTLEVLAVDDKGRQTKFHLVIHKLQAAEDDAALADLITSDVELEGTYGDNKLKFDMKKGELSKPAANCLGAFLRPRPDVVQFTNDDVMGSATNRKAGESWPMNVKLIAASMGLNAETAKGTVTLDAVKAENGVKWLQQSEVVEGPVEVNDSNLGKSKSAAFSAKGVESNPADVTDPSDKSQATHVLHAVFEVPQQDGSTMEITADRTEKRSTAVVLTGMATTKPAVEPATQSAK